MASNLSLDFGEPQPVAAVTRGALARADRSLERMVDQLEALGRQPGSPVTAIHRRPAREGRFEPLPATVDERLAKVLEGKGITQLYSHQAEAFECIRRGWMSREQREPNRAARFSKRYPMRRPGSSEGDDPVKTAPGSPSPRTPPLLK